MNFDHDKDGIISEKDLQISEQLIKLQIDNQKDQNQVRMAWVAMLSMLVITLLLFSPFVPDSRILALRDLLDLFYVAQASVVGMFMGVKAYMTRKM
jgi:hypothetical protein|nr:MAG TPA: hypothetical protein [Caudoviricetes sp.]